MQSSAQGWYRDPFAIHEDRYFSDGTPTKLVRDQGNESYDEPPPGPYTFSGLIPCSPPAEDAASGSGLRRADDAANDAPYSSAKARQLAWDVFDAGAIPVPRRR